MTKSKQKSKRKLTDDNYWKEIEERAATGEYKPTQLRLPRNREEQVLFALVSEIIAYKQKKRMDNRSLALLLKADEARISNLVRYRIRDAGRSNIYEWHLKLYPQKNRLSLPELA